MMGTSASMAGRSGLSMKLAAVLSACLVLATAAFAHQDRILSVRTDGVIPELPPTYQTTRLQIVFSEGDRGTLEKMSFLSSGRETSLQPCLLKLVQNGSFRQLFLSGSWYHDEALLPYYVEVQFRDALIAERLSGDPGIRFLFSLRDAGLLEVTRVVPIPGQNGVQHQKISLSNGCPE